MNYQTAILQLTNHMHNKLAKTIEVKPSDAADETIFHVLISTTAPGDLRTTNGEDSVTYTYIPDNALEVATMQFDSCLEKLTSAGENGRLRCCSQLYCGNHAQAYVNCDHAFLNPDLSFAEIVTYQAEIYSDPVTTYLRVKVDELKLSDLQVYDLPSLDVAILLTELNKSNASSILDFSNFIYGVHSSETIINFRRIRGDKT